MKKSRTILFALAALAISGSVSFGTYALLTNPRTAAQEPTGLQPGEARTTDTPTLASELAGYPVAVPQFIPAGFSRTDDNILVSRKLSETLPADVTQNWFFESDPSIGFTLVQDPELDGIGRSEPTDIYGQPAQRRLYPADTSRPFSSLALYWKDEQSAYSLWAVIDGPLTEEIVYKIAASVSALP